jgi:hypothetical protein
MSKIDQKWLFTRGQLHDARVTAVRAGVNKLEVDLDDEWSNERGLTLPEGQSIPVTLVFSNATNTGVIFEGSWISELLIQADGSFLFVFTESDSVTVYASRAECQLTA